MNERLGDPETNLQSEAKLFSGHPGPDYKRASWDEHGLNAAKAAVPRADCTRRRVGAALMLADKSIAVTGYNGSAAGGPSCLAGECPRGRLSHDQLAANSAYDAGPGTCEALHAEWNVLLRASWYQMQGATIYVTTEPCHLCWTLIKGTPISRVVWLEDGKIKSKRMVSDGYIKWPEDD